jgi:hypothetical protein
MGEHQGAAEPRQAWPIQDPAAIVDEIEVERAGTPTLPDPSTGHPFDPLQQPEECAESVIRPRNNDCIIEFRHKTCAGMRQGAVKVRRRNNRNAVLLKYDK